MKGKYALQFDQRMRDGNNDDGGGTSNFSRISGSGSGSFSATAAGFSAGGARTSELIQRGLVALHGIISD